jgi:hypothetical protein
MRNYLVKTGLAWLCVLSCVLTDASAALGLVLCAEPGGRVAIEPAHALGPCTGCTEEVAPPEARAADAVAPSGHCPCIDTPVVSVGDDSRPHEVVLEAGRIQVLYALASWHHWLSLFPLPDPLSGRRPSLDPPSYPTASTRLLRTVILLV